LDPARLIIASIGAAMGILAPRFRYPTLMLFSGFLALLVSTSVLLARGAEIWMVALGAPAAVFLGALLARIVPRLATLVVLALALALAALTVTGGSRPALWVALAVGVVLLVPGTWKAGLGLLVACAIFGASLAWGVGPLVAGLVPWGVTVGVYFVMGGLVMQRPGEGDEPPPWGPSLRWPLAAAAVLAAGLALVPRATPDLAPARAARAAERRDRLQAEAPEGGLVWPLPSEALLWDAPDFPALENLDALYLGDRADAGLRRVPGTSLAHGRFALNGLIHEMRTIKDDQEIALLKRACRATVGALGRSLHLYRDGGSEEAIAASVRRESARLGCEGPSFPPIIASGANALDFHYMKNDDRLVEGELVLTDVGCYAEHYACDCTRTLPVGGRFSGRARQLYDALYAAEQAAAEACRAGVYLRTGAREAPDGSKSLDAIARETLEAHGAPSDFAHGIGHPIGLFAHDVFRRGRPLESGMVIMIEPGIYIEDEGLGLRLENAYVVHEDGCELLTDGIPSDTEGLEALMADALGLADEDALVVPGPEENSTEPSEGPGLLGAEGQPIRETTSPSP
jgi:hypothetical protein